LRLAKAAFANHSVSTDVLEPRPTQAEHLHLLALAASQPSSDWKVRRLPTPGQPPLPSPAALCRFTTPLYVSLVYPTPFGSWIDESEARRLRRATTTQTHRRCCHRQLHHLAPRLPRLPNVQTLAATPTLPGAKRIEHHPIERPSRGR